MFYVPLTVGAIRSFKQFEVVGICSGDSVRILRGRDCTPIYYALDFPFSLLNTWPNLQPSFTWKTNWTVAENSAISNFFSLHFAVVNVQCLTSTTYIYLCMSVPSWLTGLNMTFPIWAQCMLNPVFRLNQSLPRLCSITAPDLCKPSVLTFIVFEFKISVPPTLLYGIYIRVLPRTRTIRTYILCCTVNLINHGASMFVNCTLFWRRSALCRSLWTC